MVTGKIKDRPPVRILIGSIYHFDPRFGCKTVIPCQFLFFNVSDHSCDTALIVILGILQRNDNTFRIGKGNEHKKAPKG